MAAAAQVKTDATLVLEAIALGIADLLNRLTEIPKGQETLAAFLRHRDWTCTPPAAAPATKPAPRRKGRT